MFIGTGAFYHFCIDKSMTITRKWKQNIILEFRQNVRFLAKKATKPNKPEQVLILRSKTLDDVPNCSNKTPDFLDGLDFEQKMWEQIKKSVPT